MDLSTFAGTVAWMAPEMIHRKGQVSEKVDVYVGAPRRLLHEGGSTGRGSQIIFYTDILSILMVLLAFQRYSYGVILWELVTQEVPFQGCNQHNVMWLVASQHKRSVGNEIQVYINNTRAH